MDTTNYTVPTASKTGGSSCHGGNNASGSWFSRRRGLVLGGGAIAAVLALAVSRHWLAAAELLPLLYLAPCALMMLMCMKGMNHGTQSGGSQTASPPDASSGTGSAVG